MLQQSAAEKKHNRSAFFHDLSAVRVDRREHQKILEYLGQDYTAAFSIAANLSWHSKWIPYAFLTNRLKKIADEMRAQGEMLRAKLTEVGGTVPQISSQSREDAGFRQNVRRLVKDMENHATRSEILIHQRNDIHDESIIRLLDAVVSEMQKQKDELLDIVMRLS